MRVKCVGQEHNTMSPARAGTQTAQSGVERTNHEATAPPNASERASYFLRARLHQGVMSKSKESTAKHESKIT